MTGAQKGPDWQDARVEAIRDITPTVREFTLRPPGHLQPYAPGSHMQVQIMVGQGAGARLHTRSYSLIGSSAAHGSEAPGNEKLGSKTPGSETPAHYRIAVKRLDDGRGGSLAMWRLGVGDRLRITGPQNHFPLDLSAPSYLLAAGGIGITPLLGMAQVLARRGAKVRLLYGARSDDELAYLAALQAALPGQVATAVATRGEMVSFANEIASLPLRAQLYVCGPAPMLDAARRAWASAGRPAADLRYETFGSSGRFAPQAFRVKVPRHQLDFEVAADLGLLDALEQQGVQALYDCRRGECGLCTMDVLAVKGEIDHRDVFLSDEEKSRNKRICVCVSRVVGEITLDSAYRQDAA
jgi:ferredoxin-NADP reductase